LVGAGGARAPAGGERVDNEVMPTAATGSQSARKEEALDLFRELPRGYDRMGAFLSFGQDPLWRRALVAAIAPEPGQRILDVATGTGLVAAQLARRGANVVGLDQSEEMLGGARRRFDAARGWTGPPVELIRAEAERLPFADGAFDALTFTYLLRYVDDPEATLRELARVVRPGGRIGMVEFGVPGAAWALAMWRLYARLGLPAIGRVAGRAWVDVGHFLGPSIEGLYAERPLERIAALWRAAGIGEVEVRRMSFGAGVVMTGVRDGHGARPG
jgi:demethylmenaquinone methyltransferase/2-methoxy-6-polyprenyl-1,4-benzoquinol methylase